MKLCEQCNEPFYVPQHVESKSRFCSQKCFKDSLKKEVVVYCSTCGTPLMRTPSKLKNSKSGLYFCDRWCKAKAQYLDTGISKIQPKHYGSGTTYRSRALRVLGKRCSRCGFEKDERMLDVDHIDCDRLNNDITNLQVLCVWCHALKTRNIEEENARLA